MENNTYYWFNIEALAKEFSEMDNEISNLSDRLKELEQIRHRKIRGLFTTHNIDETEPDDMYNYIGAVILSSERHDSDPMANLPMPKGYTATVISSSNKHNTIAIVRTPQNKEYVLEVPTSYDKIEIGTVFK